MPTTVEIPFSPETKRVLEFAGQEADRLGHGDIGTEHLLLGLLRGETSVAGEILTARGLRLDRVRADIPSVVKASSVIAGKTHEMVMGLVEQLSRTPADSVEARALVERIRRRLDDLGSRLTG